MITAKVWIMTVWMVTGGNECCWRLLCIIYEIFFFLGLKKQAQTSKNTMWPDPVVREVLVTTAFSDGHKTNKEICCPFYLHSYLSSLHVIGFSSLTSADHLARCQGWKSSPLYLRCFSFFLPFLATKQHKCKRVRFQLIKQPAKFHS